MVQPRHGYTLLELLVATAIVAVLTGLVLSGIQHSRASASRGACLNNFRQLALAAQHHNTQHDRLPTGFTGPTGEMPFLTWHARLLPFYDQQAAWRNTVGEYKRQVEFWRPTPHTNLSAIMPVLLCPAGSDRREGVTDEGDRAAFTYYLGVSGNRPGRNNGVLYLGSVVGLRAVRDGTSNTLLAGERPPSADNHFGWWYAGIGQTPGPSYDGTADSVMSVVENRRTFRAPTCHRGPYYFGPGDEDNLCDMFHYWSLHPGGAHFAFCDGSVRFLSYSAKDVLPALATRAGGEVVAVPE